MMAKSPNPLTDLIKAWFYILLAGVFLFTLAWLVNAMLPSGDVAHQILPQSEQAVMPEDMEPIEATEPLEKAAQTGTKPDDRIDHTATEPEVTQPTKPDQGLSPDPAPAEEPTLSSPPEGMTTPNGVATKLIPPGIITPEEAGIDGGSSPLAFGDTPAVVLDSSEEPISLGETFEKSEPNGPPALTLPLPETTHFEPEPWGETPVDPPPAAEKEFCLPLGDGTSLAESDLEGFILLKNEAAAFVGAVARGTIVKITHSPYTGRTVYQLESGGRHCFLYGGMGELAAGVAVGSDLDCGAAIGTTPAGNGVYFSVSAFAEGELWWQGRRIDPRPFLTRAR